MSNAVSIFDIAGDDNIVFKRTIKNGMPTDAGLGKPVGLALSPLNDELYVLGFKDNKLTIFDRDKTGELLPKQVLKNAIQGIQHFIQPHKIVVSPNGKFLYIACSGSHSIVVFNKTEQGRYAFLQVITNSDVGGLGLNGASSLVISADGSKLYAAGGAGIGLFSFEVLTNGRLQLQNQWSNKINVTEGLTGISSMTLASNGSHLLVATAKSDALFVFEIVSAKR